VQLVLVCILSLGPLQISTDIEEQRNWKNYREIASKLLISASRTSWSRAMQIRADCSIVEQGTWNIAKHGDLMMLPSDNKKWSSRLVGTGLRPSHP
jgi:hypothetical protein